VPVLLALVGLTLLLASVVATLSGLGSRVHPPTGQLSSHGS